jgi:hypothetical protein
MQQGQAVRGLILEPALPAHTNDNYKDLMMACYKKTINLTPQQQGYYCPSGHTQEYSVGHKAGWYEENWVLAQ